MGTGGGEVRQISVIRVGDPWMSLARYVRIVTDVEADRLVQLGRAIPYPGSPPASFEEAQQAPRMPLYREDGSPP